MANSRLHDIDEIRKLLRYDSTTGILTWEYRTSDKFQDGKYSRIRRANRWNAVHANKNAGYKNKKGYFALNIGGVTYCSHRIAWALHYNFWPTNQIDHIDHNRANNKIGNLRDVTNTENQRNCGMAKTNTSGYTGVYWYEPTRKWCARIWVNGKNHYLGYFIQIEDASLARENAKLKFGFHKKHGIA